MSQEDFYWELPEQLRDERFYAGFEILSRHVEFDDGDTLLSYIGNRLEKGDKVFGIAMLFFKFGMIEILQHHKKVDKVREYAEIAYKKDPVSFMDLVGIKIGNHEAFEPDPIFPTFKEQIYLAAIDRPETSKLLYSIFIACMHILKSVVSFEMMGIDLALLEHILDFCIDIDLILLDAELTKDARCIC